MINYEIRHTTKYEYNNSVTQCHNLVYLLPRDTLHQKCSNVAVSVNPRPAYSARRVDYFGNQTFYFSVERPHRSLTVTSRSRIQVEQERPTLNLDFGVTCEQALGLMKDGRDEQTLVAREFMLDSPMVAAAPELEEFARPFFDPDRPLLSSTRELTTQIFKEFTYDPEFTSIATPLSEVLEHRRGVCQDFAHLAIGCLRSMGFAARYVSGYIETVPPAGQEKLVGSDATHAWVAVYSPGEGWFEFDPTNDKLAEEQHITTAWGRDYSDVSPLKGVIFGGGDQQMLSVAVDVNRRTERVTG
ncbi:MAG: transglutaminase family protein [Pseudomonadales bacterium]|nr:transglutaminase family protein [Pseudomonadales bacterium]